MREIAKWAAPLVIVLVAISPLFEAFDRTDGLAQDTSDLVRYALCLFCFLSFALRRTVIILRFTSFRRSAPGPIRRPVIETHTGAMLVRSTAYTALFLTLHDLRI